MMGYWYGGLGWIGMVINLVISVVLIIGLILLVVWTMKRLSNNNSGRTLDKTLPSAVEIARERYAKGEISREAYQMLLIDLETR